MLGGGIYVTQNKTLPGSYINVVSATRATSTLGDRGIVAIAIPLVQSNAGKVIECTAQDYVQNHDTVLGESIPANSDKALREIFKHATKVIIFNNITPTSGTAPTVSAICKALEPYEFNVLACYTKISSDITSYVTQIKTWRDDYGKKCVGVVYNPTTAPDYEGIINVVSKVSDSGADEHALVAWVSGAEAGCKINSSCTNMLYDGEYTIICDKTQSELETCIQNGQIAFHLVYGDVRMLEDINSLKTTSADKGEDFKSNQTVRVVDQIANDIAKLYNTRYLGVIPNNDSGRKSLWADIVSHHRKLEAMQAIEDFDTSLLTVEQGETKKSVVVYDVVKAVNAMAQLYMTVVVQ